MKNLLILIFIVATIQSCDGPNQLRNQSIKTAKYSLEFFLPFGFKKVKTDTIYTGSLNAGSHYQLDTDSAVQLIVWCGLENYSLKNKITNSDLAKIYENELAKSKMTDPNATGKLQNINGREWYHVTYRIPSSSYYVQSLLSRVDNYTVEIVANQFKSSADRDKLFEKYCDTVFRSLVIKE